MSGNKEVIYTSASEVRNITGMISKIIREFPLAREIGWRLAVRDIRSMYRQTFLGISWAVIMPLINTATWLFLKGSGIVNLKGTEIPYTVYVVTGTMLWQIFSESLQSPVKQLNDAKVILSKINLPKESIIIAGMLKVAFNSIIRIGFILAIVFIFGIFSGWSLLLFPLTIISIIFFGTALGLLFAPLGTLYNDIGRGLQIIATFWMYISPVVFAMPDKAWALKIFKLNPMTYLISCSRDMVTGIRFEQWSEFLYINLAMLVILFISWILYRISMPVIIERMSA